MQSRGLAVRGEREVVHEVDRLAVRAERTAEDEPLAAFGPGHVRVDQPVAVLIEDLEEVSARARLDLEAQRRGLREVMVPPPADVAGERVEGLFGGGRDEHVLLDHERAHGQLGDGRRRRHRRRCDAGQQGEDDHEQRLHLGLRREGGGPSPRSSLRRGRRLARNGVKIVRRRRATGMITPVPSRESPMNRTLCCLVLSCLSACGAVESLGTARPLAMQSGAELFVSQKCATCHGEDGRGTWMDLGPSLEGVAEFWTETSLVRYLGDPAGYAVTDPRLGEREMPSYETLGVGEARRLAQHVLELGR